MRALLVILQLESGKNDWKKKMDRLKVITSADFQVMNMFIFLNLTLVRWAKWWAQQLGLNFPTS